MAVLKNIVDSVGYTVDFPNSDAAPDDDDVLVRSERWESGPGQPLGEENCFVAALRNLRHVLCVLLPERDFILT